MIIWIKRIIGFCLMFIAVLVLIPGILFSIPAILIIEFTEEKLIN